MLSHAAYILPSQLAINPSRCLLGPCRIACTLKPFLDHAHHVRRQWRLQSPGP